MAAWAHLCLLLLWPSSGQVLFGGAAASSDRPRRLGTAPTCAMNEPVTLMSYRGLYLSDQRGSIVFSENACGWEQWEIRESTDGSVTIQSHTGKFLSSQRGTLALAPVADAWEQFRIEDGGDGKINIVNFEGKYLQDSQNRVVMSSSAGKWEQWRVMLPDDSPACVVGQPSRAMPAGCASEHGCATLVQTARFTGDRMKVLGEMPFETDDTDDEGIVVDVSSVARDQAIVGFGGAFTESSAHLFAKLPGEKQGEIIERYFGRGDEGIGFNAGRVHINSCDFSPVGNWNEDDVAGDVHLDHFDGNVTHDAAEMIPFIKAAMAKIEAVGDRLDLVASPWSPPAWMKRSGRMQSSSRGWQSCVRDEYVSTWAKYISRWITAYKEKGVPMWAVTVQNEPDNTPRWEACWFPIHEEATFVRDYLGPELNKTHPGVGIFFMDSYKRFEMEEWAEAFYGDTDGAAKYVTGFALHWYNGDYFEDIARVHARLPQAMILQSEATWEFSRTGYFCQVEHGVWRFGEGYAHDIIGVLNAGGVGWIDWNLLLDDSGGPNHVGNMCDAAIMVRGTDYYIHPQFWYMGHFSKYLPKGSRRIPLRISGSRAYRGTTRSYGSCSAEDGLQATAFERPSDGAVVLVVLNCAEEAASFKIRRQATALRAEIPAHAIQTYVIGGADARRLAPTLI